MGNILRFFGGVLLTALIVIVTLARLAIEIVGASTTPDDLALLKQRMPAMLSWLFSTPWWVPTVLLFGASATAAWLIWSGTKRAAAHEMQEHDALDEQAIAAMIESRLAQIQRPEGRSDLATYADLHTHDVKLAELADQIRFARGLVDGGHEAQEARFKQIESKLDQVIAYAEQRTRALSDRFENIDDAFAALRNRDWHQKLFFALEEDFEDLAKPVDAGGGIGDPDAWTKSVKSWRAKLDQWLVIADFYAMGAAERILAMPEHLYEGEWSFDEKPLTANQVHHFKEIGIWWHNAKEEKARIDKCFAAAIFDAPSMKGRPGPIPRPTEDQ